MPTIPQQFRTFQPPIPFPPFPPGAGTDFPPGNGESLGQLNICYELPKCPTRYDAFVHSNKYICSLRHRSACVGIYQRIPGADKMNVAILGKESK